MRGVKKGRGMELNEDIADMDYGMVEDEWGKRKKGKGNCGEEVHSGASDAWNTEDGTCRGMVGREIRGRGKWRGGEGRRKRRGERGEGEGRRKREKDHCDLLLVDEDQSLGSLWPYRKRATWSSFPSSSVDLHPSLSHLEWQSALQSPLHER